MTDINQNLINALRESFGPADLRKMAADIGNFTGADSDRWYRLEDALREAGRQSLEERLANRRAPGDPDYDPFYDATDGDLSAMIPPRPEVAA